MLISNPNRIYSIYAWLRAHPTPKEYVHTEYVPTYEQTEDWAYLSYVELHPTNLAVCAYAYASAHVCDVSPWYRSVVTFYVRGVLPVLSH